MKRLIAIVTLMLVSSATAIAAPPGASQPEVVNPRIATMPDNSWLRLNPAHEVDGRNNCGVCFGGGRLLYFGGMPISYQGNDVQLYDPAANDWSRSWKPEFYDDVEKQGRVDLLEAVFDAKTGRPWAMPTYQQVCYVPDRKVFFYSGHAGTWQFDPATAKWTNLAGPFAASKKDAPHTNLAWQSYHTFYALALKAPVCIVTATPPAVHVYDFEKNEWAQRAKPIPDKMKWYELYSTYIDSLDMHLISQRGTPFMWLYDAKTEQFKPVAHVPEPLQGTQAIAYDSINDVVIGLAQYKLKPEVDLSKLSVQVWSMDPKTLAWSEVKPAGPRPEGYLTGAWAPLAFAPAANAFYFINRTKQTEAETWGYRYRGR